uniref:Uncharacterized protein n=1 Tax=Hemiselmis andersenii TaxID=464988 RepID=A0A6U4UAE4_HEMAN|mmetsp:Transcript_505/g.1193  ORF Transcript_505/g.1193 Transcript_505/m.1193 type:complete len:152 (+) Transcript_505:118-573(+)
MNVVMSAQALNGQPLSSSSSRVQRTIEICAAYDGLREKEESADAKGEEDEDVSSVLLGRDASIYANAWSRKKHLLLKKSLDSQGSCAASEASIDSLAFVGSSNTRESWSWGQGATADDAEVGALRDFRRLQHRQERAARPSKLRSKLPGEE